MSCAKLLVLLTELKDIVAAYPHGSKHTLNIPKRVKQ
jgi:hypothetical protein